MARSTPTEESLGLTPTDDELATVSAPSNDEDDIPQDDEPTPVVEAAQPGVRSDDKPAETPAEPAEPVATKPEDPKTVDLRALQEARATERELRQQNAILQQRTNEVLAMVAAQQQQPAQQEQPRQRPGGDPMALLEYLAEKIDRQEITANEARQVAAQEGYRQQALQQIHTLEQEFKATTPDYDAAIDHLRETRTRELEIMFPLSTPQQRSEYIGQEWQNIVNQSAQAGLNPVQQVYNLAKARGFSAPAPAPTVTTPVQPNLQAVAAAQQRHQSLSDAPGGETVAPLDAKSLARMSDKEFKAWMSKKGNEAKFDDIMGR